MKDHCRRIQYEESSDISLNNWILLYKLYIYNFVILLHKYQCTIIKTFFSELRSKMPDK